jgi:hypothetical protein
MTWILLHTASRLLPREQRAEWRREWEAEIWHARRSGVPPRIVRRWLLGAIADAACLGLRREVLVRRMNAAAQTPGFCLASLLGVLLVIAIASGGLPASRDVFVPLPYADAGRVATISRAGGSISMRGGIPAEWVRLWSRKSKTLEAISTYGWSYEISAGERVLAASVSPGFFSVLGVSAPAPCAGCVVLSQGFRRRFYSSDREAIGREIPLGNAVYRIAGVLPANFWFLSREIGIWKIGSSLHTSGAGVVVRLRAGVTPGQAERELYTLLQERDFSTWGSLVDVSILQDRVHSPLDSFLLAFSLAIIVAVLASRPRLRNLDVTSLAAWRRGAFFAAKSLLLLLAVLLAGLEFTSACSITMIGGTDLLAEPLSTWLFLIGCMTALTWSIHDHRVRCRECMRRLGLAAHVGCPGSLLLSWAGTELVCISGHGMIHVPEMPSCWLEPERWTALDSSWRELFVQHG